MKELQLVSQVVQSTSDRNLSLVRIYRAPDKANDATNVEVTTTILDKSLKLLQGQWPRENDDTDTDYYRDFIIHHDTSYPNYSLACSYILIQQQSSTSQEQQYEVLGHGRLTECYESGGGNAAAATYIIIDKRYRGKGYGAILLNLLEREALSSERLGFQYHFIYLWCKIGIASFYKQNGYLPSRNRISLHRPCLKGLSLSSVQSIEDLLTNRHDAITKRKTLISNDDDKQSDNNNIGTIKKIETVMLLSSKHDDRDNKASSSSQGNDHPAEDDIWLCKRLVDHVDSIHISKEDRMTQMKHFITNNSPTTTSTTVHWKWYFCWNSHVPWQPQIGPSCGLTAIRMVKDFYFSLHSRKRQYNENLTQTSSFDSVDNNQSSGLQQDSAQSLLADAQNRGYTKDGEIFHVEHLRELMESQLNSSTMIVRTRETSSLTVKEIDFNLKIGGLWILSYDNNPFTKLPCNYLGKRAHWGILVAILYLQRVETTTSTNIVISRPSLISLGEEVGLSSLHDPKQVSDNASTDCYWCVQHSLSSEWSIAPMEKWVESNLQLKSYNDSKFSITNENYFHLQNRIIQVSPQF